MNSTNLQHQKCSYSDTFFNCFVHNETSCTCMYPEHVLVLVYSGELIACSGDCKVTARQGEYVFLRRDFNIVLVKRPLDGQPFSSVFIGFGHDFLCNFFQTIEKPRAWQLAEPFENSIIKLAGNPYIDSLYTSLLPYLSCNTKPSRRVLVLKQQEAVHSLLLSDRRFYPCLFECCCVLDVNN